MAVPEVDRLRADVAVLERRLERVEKTTALASDTIAALRRRVEEGGGAPSPSGSGAAEARETRVRDEVRAARADIAQLDQRTGAVEERTNESDVALAEVRDAVAKLRHEVTAMREQLAALATAMQAAAAAPKPVV